MLACWYFHTGLEPILAGVVLTPAARLDDTTREMAFAPEYQPVQKLPTKWSSLITMKSGCAELDTLARV